MKRRSDSCRRLLCGLLLLVLVLGLCRPVYAAEKYMNCTSADFHLELDSMGNLYVSENWSYFFGGGPITRYARRYRHPEPGVTEYSGIHVFLDGVELNLLSAPDEARPEGCAAVYEENDETVIEVYLNAYYEEHTISVEYNLSSAVILHEDVAELRWNFSSTHEAFDIDALDATIVLPEAVETRGMSFWGHGPTENGFFIAEEEDGFVDTFWLHTENVAKDQNVSARFAMPLDLFPYGKRFETGKAYDRILEEEHALQDAQDGLTPPTEAPAEETQAEETQPEETLTEETQPPETEPVETEPFIPEEPTPVEPEEPWYDYEGLSLRERLKFYYYEHYSVISDFLDTLANFSALLVVLVVAVAALLLHRLRRFVTGRFTTDHQEDLRLKPEQSPLYYRSLPDDMKPALVYKLLSVYAATGEGHQTMQEGNPFSATLLDLIERNLIYMERGADGMLRYFVNPQAKQANLTAYERRLVNLYISMGADEHPMTTREITQFLHGARSACGNVYHDFLYRDLQPAFDQTGLAINVGIDNGKTWVKLLIGFGVGGLVYLLLSSWLGTVIPLLIGALVGRSAARRYQKMVRNRLPEGKLLTQEGENRYALWKAYERFLNEFTTFEEKQVEDVRVWKRHLVYATAIGCCPKVVENLRSVLPQVYQAIQEDYGMEVGRESVFSSIRDIQQECDRPTHVSSDSSSSFDGWSSDDRDWGGMSDSDDDYDSGSSGSDFD